MSQTTCSRCGMPLKGGVCPRGHPQRAARRRKRRVGKFVFVPLLILALLAGGAYAALFWYPVQAAEKLIEPASEGFSEARAAYTTAVDAFPSSIDPESVAEVTATIRDGASEARTVLAREQSELEARKPTSIPVISGRPPLRLASRLRARMIDFYIGGLELVTDLESVAGYLSELAPTLPRLEDLRGAVGAPGTPQAVDPAVAAAKPIADQLVADVEALTPPVELRTVHESLGAVAKRLRASLDDLDAITGRGSAPIIASLVASIGRELDSFRGSVVSAPEEALRAGIGSRLEELARQQRRIIRGLTELRDDHDLAVTVPNP